MNIDDNCIIKPCGKCYYRADCVRCMLHEIEWVLRYKYGEVETEESDLSSLQRSVQEHKRVEDMLQVQDDGRTERKKVKRSSR
jgi:hypothetical protein